ncbi:MAG: lipopolysaccharide transport periplasmic protein LptA [Candidatus Rokubacteria bacterium]|nr:lipopolysaccharide transport periplasmic protein LptA [Candidatus Rokubacteria bacterium]
MRGARRIGVILLAAVLGPQLALFPLDGLAQPAKPKKPASSRSEPGPKARSEAPAPKPEEDEKNQPVIVDADQLESLKKEGLVIFTGNVVARQNTSVLYADRMEVYLDAKAERVVRTVSVGNVRIITKDCRVGTAKRAEYYDAEQRVVLIGNARVWQEDNVVTGDRITMFLAEERSVVQSGKQERVKAVFYPKSQDAPKAERPAVSGPFPCR